MAGGSKIEGAVEEVHNACNAKWQKGSYRVQLSDESLADMKVLTKTITGSAADASFKIVSNDVYMKKGKDKAFPIRMYSVPLSVRWHSLDGIGKESDKYPDKDMASRRRVLQCKTYIPKRRVKEINRNHHIQGYDIKEEQRFFVQRMKEVVKKINDEIWNQADVQRDRKTTFRMNALKHINDSPDELKKLGIAKATLATPAVEELAKKYFFDGENYSVAIYDDEEHEGEHIIVFKAKLAKWKNKNTMPQEEDKYTLAAVKAEFANACPDVAKMDDEEYQEKFAFFVRKFLEERGYEFKEIEYHNNNHPHPKRIRLDKFTIPFLHADCIVQVPFYFSPFSSVRYGYRLTMADRVDIIKLYPKPKFEEDPDKYGFADDVTYESMMKMKEYDENAENDSDLSDSDDSGNDDSNHGVRSINSPVSSNKIIVENMPILFDGHDANVKTGELPLTEEEVNDDDDDDDVNVPPPSEESEESEQESQNIKKRKKPSTEKNSKRRRV